MNNFLNNSEDLLIKFHPIYRKQIKELLLNGDVGLDCITSNDISPLEPKYYTDVEGDNNFSFNFNFKVPYAGKKLPWVVIFNPDKVEFAPDFDFNDDSFIDDDNDIIVEHISALVNWDVKDSKALKSVLKQFLNLYKQCQIKKIREDNMYARISSEIKFLNCDKNFSGDDFEILLDGCTVHFMIRIKVTCEDLPEFLQQSEEEIQNPGEDVAFLKVSYLKLDASRVSTHLCLSTRLEQILGNSKTLHIPKYGKDTVLITYVSTIKNLLSDLIKQVKESYKYRKTLITYLIALKKSAVIEYDSHAFKKLVLLFNVNDYYCLVQIELGNHFPVEKPTVRLYSVYCLDLGNPCFKDVTNLPYCPRWTCEEFAEQLFNFLNEAILDFKSHKH